MKKFFEVEFIGRGGQGAKTAAEIVAKIALKAGKFVQSFPDYGPERKGAPVRSFTRISDIEIRGCSSEANPDVIIIIDPSLLSLNGALFTINPEQIVIVNSSVDPTVLKSENNISGRLFAVDATGISFDVLKKNIPNSPMLGAFAKVSGMFDLETVKKEFEEEFERKLDRIIIEKNFEAIEKAYAQVRE
jgi:pyruvate ferredoxin oxidoreductase gamma subunit